MARDNNLTQKQRNRCALTENQRERYARQMRLSPIGEEGQERLLKARVLLVGTGGLGSPATFYLAAAGAGTLGLIDPDVVDLSNLQRQIIHTTPDLGRPKVESAREKIQALNPDVRVVEYRDRLSSANALEIIRDYDVVVDGTDNFPTRYLVNDACVMTGRTCIHGSIFRFDGQISVFKPRQGPCYRCIYPEPPPPGMVPSCAEAGVLGVLPGFVGSVMALEAIKVILERGAAGEGLQKPVGPGLPEPAGRASDTLAGRLLLYNSLDMDFCEVKVRRDPNCPVCGDQPTVRQLVDYEEFCHVR